MHPFLCLLSPGKRKHTVAVFLPRCCDGSEGRGVGAAASLMRRLLQAVPPVSHLRYHPHHSCRCVSN